MKTCPSCGCNNADDSTRCVSCGFVFASNHEQMQYSNSSYGQPNAQINVNFPMGGGFVSNDEYVVATLSNDVVTNIASGEGFKAEGAVLTNKRLYYNYKTGVINVHRQENIVNVKDITGSKVATFNPVGTLVLSILVLLLGILATVASSEGTIILAVIPVALFFFLVYIFARKAHLRIEYAGGTIYFSVKKYGKEKISNFQKSIYAVKDHIDASGK